MTLATRLIEERRARLAAERLLELRQAELFAANQKLGKHAQALSAEIVETRARVASVQGAHKRTQSDLVAAREKIALTERQLWQSIEAMDDGFAIFNPDNELVMANSAYFDHFEGLEIVRPGVNYITLLQLFTDEGIIDTGDIAPDTWRAMMAERLKAAQPAPVKVRLWDGRFVTMLDARSPEGDLVSRIRDMTSEVTNAQALEQARKQAEAANRAKSSFLANMTHEFRTPLNGVIGMADLLIEGDLDSEQRLFAETIKQSADALLVIINDVLDFSKIEADRLTLKQIPFDLRDTIQETLTLLMPSARQKGIMLRLDYARALPARAIGDPGRLRQILTNLVGNAVKFTAEGEVHVTVSVGETPAEQSFALDVTVRDTGIGIPTRKIEHIFGAFNQVEDNHNRQFEGTGLGLAITQRLVESMGGTIAVTSEPGTGTTFNFSVTLVGEAVPGAGGDGAFEEVVFTTLDPEKREGPRLMRVLAAEDNKTNQFVFQKLVKDLNIDLVFAENGEQAIALFNEVKPDLVFMDISMPRMDGKEATRAIRKLDAGADVPIIALTAHALPEQAEEILNAGMDKHLTKPLRKDRIIAEIEAAHCDGLAPLRGDQAAG